VFKLFSPKAGRTLVAVVGISASLAATAFADVVPAGGGTWNYGRNASIVWSKYLHNDKTHKSSVVNGDGDYQSSGWVSRGKWSDASTRATWSGNKSYYDNK
jgi:lactococcin 972 family bacteriocin